MPHPDFGEGVDGRGRADDRRRRSTRPTILAALASRLASFKLPKRVFFVDELPRNTMGKVQKNALRERYRDLCRSLPGDCAGMRQAGLPGRQH